MKRDVVENTGRHPSLNSISIWTVYLISLVMLSTYGVLGRWCHTHFDFRRTVGDEPIRVSGLTFDPNKDGNNQVRQSFCSFDGKEFQRVDAYPETTPNWKVFLLPHVTYPKVEYFVLRSSWLPSPMLLWRTVVLPVYLWGIAIPVLRITLRAPRRLRRVGFAFLPILLGCGVVLLERLGDWIAVDFVGNWKHPIILCTIPALSMLVVHNLNRAMLIDISQQIIQAIAISFSISYAMLLLSKVIAMPPIAIECQVIVRIVFILQLAGVIATLPHVNGDNTGRLSTHTYAAAQQILRFVAASQFMQGATLLVLAVICLISQPNVGLGITHLVADRCCYAVTSVAIILWLVAWLLQARSGRVGKLTLYTAISFIPILTIGDFAAFFRSNQGPFFL